MKDFAKVLPFLLPYKKNIFLNFFFNILAAIFSVFSFAMIMPFLGIIFKTQELVTDYMPFEFTTASIKHSALYYLSKIIAEHGELAGLLTICSMLSFSIMLKAGFDYLAKFFNVEVQNGAPRDLYNKMYEKIVELPVSYFSEERKGDIMARMSSDITVVRDSMINSFDGFLKNPVTLLIFLSTLIYLSPQLTLFILILLPVSGFFLGRLSKKLKSGSGEAQAKQGEILSLIEESLAGMRVIKAFNATNYILNKFRNINNQLKSKQDEVLRRNYLASPVSESMGMVIFSITMSFGGALVLNSDSFNLNAEEFIYYMALFSQIISPAKAFTSAFYNMQKGAASLERIHKVLDAEVSIKDKPDAISKKSFDTSIEFKNVIFSYNEDRTILKNIDISLEKGKSIALVGQSGSGKTTIANLLPRFYDIQQGEILIDGVNLKDYKLEDLRGLMGIVTQDSILFNDTFYNNIAFGLENVPEEKVIEAAKIANAYDFIMETPDGFQTNIGDGGGKLSGGQRQRISIARAVLKNPPILILDEATSALDTQSERLVQEALLNLMKNRTSLVIAHRLSTIKHADEIFVMNEGRIVEHGKHEALIEKDGAYKKLHDLQLI